MKFDEVYQRLWSAAMLAGALTILVAGCSSKPPPPPYQPPGAQVSYPAPALTSDQMAKLCQEASDTCHRVQTGQPLTLGDIKVMARLNFSSDTIISQVRNSHTVFNLTADNIIDLKKWGVSDQVVNFLISTPTSIAGSSPVPEPSNSSSAQAQVPPPAPIDETPPPAPGPDYAWVGGDWVWNGGWVWVGGRWAIPPYPHAIWWHGGWRGGRSGYYRGRGRWR